VISETVVRNRLALVVVEVGSVSMASHSADPGYSCSAGLDQLVEVHAVVGEEVVHHLTVHADALKMGSLHTASSLVEIVVLEDDLVSLFLVLVWVGGLEVPSMHSLMCHSTRADVMLWKACQMTLVEVVEDHSAK